MRRDRSPARRMHVGGVRRVRHTEGVKLVSIRVRMFRNVIDSGEVPIDPAVTCLVGKNESGKTALLHAMCRLNPVYPEHKFNEADDYPRWKRARDRRSGLVNGATPTQGTFALDHDDVAAVTEVLGDGAITVTTPFVYTMKYDGTTETSFEIDDARVVQNAFNAVGTPDALRQALSGCDTLEAIPPAAKALPTPEADSPDPGWDADVKRLNTLVQERLAGSKSAFDRAFAILKGRMPKFFYFDDYHTLPGRIDMRQLSGTQKPGESAIQTARSLLELAGADTTSLSAEDFDARKNELETVSVDLTQQVFEYWKQNPHLSVEIDVDKTTETGPHGQTAVARYLEVRVKDSRHGFTNNFGQRSSGFQWFFSFLAAFTAFENYEHGVVVLLDEPALTLHGRAQADFLRFIDERLAPEAQVVFTTHSPFMVEPGHLERVRIVEDRGPDSGVVVTENVLTVGDDSLFPLQAALGYDIAQNLFVGPDNLVVEGTSDYTYLTVLSDHLRDLGRIHLDDRWRVLPAGGASNVPSFVALVGPSLDVTALVDGSSKGIEKLKNLTDRKLLADKRLLVTDAYTNHIAPSDIEDLFTPGEYLALYNEAFNTQLKVADLNGSDRIIARITRATGTPFVAHGRPADALLRNRAKHLKALSDGTLTRFERLFTDINATLSN